MPLKKVLILASVGFSLLLNFYFLALDSIITVAKNEGYQIAINNIVQVGLSQKAVKIPYQDGKGEQKVLNLLLEEATQ